MAEIQLSAEKREKLGGSSANELRRKGRVPGVIYGHGDESVPFHVKSLDLRPLIYTQETHTVILNLDGKSQRAILREVQFHPVTDRVSHIDLIALHAGEKIRVEAPIMLTGTAAGAKDGGIIDWVLHRVAIEVDPDQIPEHIVVDLTALRIGHAIHIHELPPSEGYSYLNEPNAVVVSCTPPKTAVEPAAAETAIAEPEQIKAKGKKEEEK